MKKFLTMEWTTSGACNESERSTRVVPKLKEKAQSPGTNWTVLLVAGVVVGPVPSWELEGSVAGVEGVGLGGVLAFLLATCGRVVSVSLFETSSTESSRKEKNLGMLKCSVASSHEHSRPNS
jgi:hypothetical protein